MALKITNTQDEYEYVPVDQREDAKPFTVKFKVLSLDLQAEAQDTVLNVGNDQRMTMHVNTQNLLALRNGLIGWENITDSTGKTIKFRVVHGLAATECLEYLPQDLRTEIANIILTVSKDPTQATTVLNA